MHCKCEAPCSTKQEARTLSIACPSCIALFNLNSNVLRQRGVGRGSTAIRVRVEPFCACVGACVLMCVY